MTKNLSYVIATLFGAGYFPKAPGTFGSLVSLPIIFVVCYYFGFIGLLITVLFAFAVAMPAVKKVLTYTEHDPSFVVIDEFIGQAITFLPVADRLTWKFNTMYKVFNNEILLSTDIKFLILYLAGFVFFRLFDIYKPYPVSYADKKIKNAFGVILDDIFAGIYAAIFVLLIVVLSYKL
ncbi:MAG: phosphatidylglycerophosphatase A [Elusimicrobia bacterium]|nr:phosphatidylglycerophosphatase A [Elusimicrobiota bacterium]